MSKKHVAMWNLPGCLPEMEPMAFDSFDEAKRAIISEMKDRENACEPEEEEEAEEWCHLAGDVNLESDEFAVVGPDGYAYCVQALRERGMICENCGCEIAPEGCWIETNPAQEMQRCSDTACVARRE